MVIHVPLVSVISPAGRSDESDMASERVAVTPAEWFVLS